MAGNVWEWCRDWYAEDAYKVHRHDDWDPEGPGTGNTRVWRGGAFDDVEPYCRCAYRNLNYPNVRYDSVGFRIVLRPPA